MATLPEAVTAPVGSSDWRQVWLDSYPCDMPTTVPYPRAPLTALLETTARRFPDRPACTLYGMPTTFAQLDDQARRLARSLAGLGARPGRHVGLLLPNIPEYLVALQAVWLTGATALQLSPLMVAEEVGHWLETTGCHLVVTLDLLAPAVIGSLRRGPLERPRPDLAGPAHRRLARDALPLRAPPPQRLPPPAQRRPPTPLRPADPGGTAGRAGGGQSGGGRGGAGADRRHDGVSQGGDADAPQPAVQRAAASQLLPRRRRRRRPPRRAAVLPFLRPERGGADQLGQGVHTASAPALRGAGGAGAAGGAAARHRAGGARHAARAEQGDARPAARPFLHPDGLVGCVGAGAGRAARIRELWRPQPGRGLRADRGQPGDARQPAGRGATGRARSACRCPTRRRTWPTPTRGPR